MNSDNETTYNEATKVLEDALNLVRKHAQEYVQMYGTTAAELGRLAKLNASGSSGGPGTVRNLIELAIRDAALYQLANGRFSK